VGTTHEGYRDGAQPRLAIRLYPGTAVRGKKALRADRAPGLWTVITRRASYLAHSRVSPYNNPNASLRIVRQGAMGIWVKGASM
jgi:hypothetical protein